MGCYQTWGVLDKLQNSTPAPNPAAPVINNDDLTHGNLCNAYKRREATLDVDLGKHREFTMNSDGSKHIFNCTGMDEAGRGVWVRQK